MTVADYPTWRKIARQLLSQSVAPDQIAWLTASDQPGLPFPSLTAADAPDFAVEDRPLVAGAAPVTSTTIPV